MKTVIVNSSENGSKKLLVFLGLILSIGIIYLSLNKNPESNSDRVKHTADVESTTVSGISIPIDYSPPTVIESIHFKGYEVLFQGHPISSSIIDAVDLGVTNNPVWTSSPNQAIIDASLNGTTDGIVLVKLHQTKNNPNLRDMRRTTGVAEIIIKGIVYGCIPIYIPKGCSATNALLKIKSVIP